MIRALFLSFLMMLACLASWSAPTIAQAQITATVVSSCGTPPSTYHVGQVKPVTQDTTAKLCDQGGGGGGGSALPNSTASSTSPTYTAGNQNLSTDLHGGLRVLNMDASGNPLDPSAPVNCGPTSTFVQCMTLTGGTVGLVAGTAIVGKVGIDQTTPGTTNGVQLTAGTAIAGKVGIDQTTPGTTNRVAIADTNNTLPDYTATANAGMMIAPGKNVSGTFTQAVSETCDSGNVANATAACTLATATGKTTYITGFTMSASGATAAAVVTCTLTGTITGTKTYIFTFPIGVAVQAPQLTVTFPVPIPASATNTTIVASCPAGGTGNTHAAMTAEGLLL